MKYTKTRRKFFEPGLFGKELDKNKSNKSKIKIKLLVVVVFYLVVLVILFIRFLSLERAIKLYLLGLVFLYSIYYEILLYAHCILYIIIFYTCFVFAHDCPFFLKEIKYYFTSFYLHYTIRVSILVLYIVCICINFIYNSRLMYIVR